MITTRKNGFSLGVIAAVVAVVVIIGGLGYVYYTRTHQKSATTSSVTAQPGTTGHVVQDITNEMQSESSAETSADSGTQQAVTSDTGSAGNVGGAYNENSL